MTHLNPQPPRALCWPQACHFQSPHITHALAAPCEPPQLASRRPAAMPPPAFLLLLLLAISALTAAHSTTIIINGLECPPDVLAVPAGTDLGSQALNKDDTTFRLEPGTYSVQMGAIVVREGSRRCYIGAPAGAAGPQPTTITPQLDGADNETRAAFQSFGALGLAHIVLDGAQVASKSGSYRFPQRALDVQSWVPGLGITPVLAAHNTIVRSFAAPYAAAMHTDIVQGAGRIRISSGRFINNTAKWAGAGQCTSQMSLQEVEFHNNTATATTNNWGGGAILAMDDCDITLTGRTAFVNNTAGQCGGALHILDGRVTVDGPMCAQANKAAAGGGFAFVQLTGATEESTRGVLNFTERSAGSRLAADAAPNIEVFSLMRTWGQGKVVCAGSSKPWPPGRYSVTGDPCACSADFVREAATTCDSCEGGWDPEACDCKLANNPREPCPAPS